MKRLFVLLFAFSFTTGVFAQNSVGIGTTTPDASAALDISSTSKGLLMPRMTTAQRMAIATPAQGLMLFDTDLNSYYYYNGSQWNSIAGSALSLPYSQTINSAVTGFKITNDGLGAGVEGASTNEYGIGLLGSSSGGGGWGVYGYSNRATAKSINAYADSGSVFNGENLYNGNTNTLMSLINRGLGKTISINNLNTSSTSSILQMSGNGIGAGITLNLTNASNGARGIDVNQSGVGPGVFSISKGGNAVWGITQSISAAGVIGDNTYGEAVVGRTRGGNGVGAVVGRNDSSGYGVRGFNTEDGIGVLGQAGISGGTGVGGRFENVNSANGNNALEAATNGTGWAGYFTNANNSSAGKGIRVSTTAGYGGNALYIANGTFATSYQRPYASNTTVDDAILVITTTGTTTIPTGPPLPDGAHIWVINNSGGAVSISNTTAGALSIANSKMQHFIFVSAISGANWIPAQ